MGSLFQTGSDLTVGLAEWLRFVKPTGGRTASSIRIAPGAIGFVLYLRLRRVASIRPNNLPPPRGCQSANGDAAADGGGQAGFESTTHWLRIVTVARMLKLAAAIRNRHAAPRRPEI